MMRVAKKGRLEPIERSGIAILVPRDELALYFACDAKAIARLETQLL